VGCRRGGIRARTRIDARRRWGQAATEPDSRDDPSQKKAETPGDHSADEIDDEPDWESAATSAAGGDVESALPDEGWEDEVTDFVAADVHPPGIATNQ
jgi:hypothetical protein